MWGHRSYFLCRLSHLACIIDSCVIPRDTLPLTHLLFWCSVHSFFQCTRITHFSSALVSLTFPVHSYYSLFQCTLFGALFETHVGLCALPLFGALFLFSSPTDQSYLNWLVSFGQNYFNRNLPRRNSLMSAHLCLPRQLPCSFPVEIVELPLTPPHAWYVHANNRGKLISPTWNLFIKLSQFMVCQGNRLTGRGRMKTQGRWHFIDFLDVQAIWNCKCMG